MKKRKRKGVFVMARKSLLVLALLCAAVFGPVFTVNANAASPDNPKCDALSGAAYGMCLSAYAIGCDDKVTANPGCATIASKFSQVTGQTPVWLLPPCPCGAAADFERYLSADGGAGSCIDKVDAQIIVYGSSPTSFYHVWSMYPAYTGSTPTCGFNGVSKIALTTDEASSCIAELKSIISQNNLTCTGR